MLRFVRVRDVDNDGVSLRALGDGPVDVCIDDRRVWTFWVLRDTQAQRVLWRHAPWPQSLRRHLNGRSRIVVRDSATGKVYFDRELTLGEGDGPIRVRNQKGVELGIDKSGRLVPTFEGRSEQDVSALLDAVEAVIAAVRSSGVEPFLAYGTLLGAVRGGRVLAHDSDADLGYVSHHSNPVDVARESFQIQRQLQREGWTISRYSGSAFKIHVTEADVTRGLDVFGGFLDSGRLYLMGEIGTEFERDWIFPLGSCALSGRPMPVPANPGKLLEAMYGPSWKVPDPAFKFATPERTIRALEDWFRGTQPNYRYWDRRANVRAGRPLRAPSGLAKLAREVAERLGAEVVDIGAGRGDDSAWLVSKGIPVTAYDYVPRALQDAQALAETYDAELEVRYLNLAEWRSVYAEGARLASRPRPRVVLARHIIDATSSDGRASLARLCSMAMREGGQLLAEFHLPNGAGDPEWMVGRPDVDSLTTLLRDAGASRVEARNLPRGERPTVRLVGEW